MGTIVYPAPLRVVFKNDDAGSNAIPILELASYHCRMVAFVGHKGPSMVSRSRLPTIIGMFIIFEIAQLTLFCQVPLSHSSVCWLCH